MVAARPASISKHFARRPGDRECAVRCYTWNPPSRPPEPEVSSARLSSASSLAAQRDGSLVPLPSAFTTATRAGCRSSAICIATPCVCWGLAQTHRRKGPGRVHRDATGTGLDYSGRSGSLFFCASVYNILPVPPGSPLSRSGSAIRGNAVHIEQTCRIVEAYQRREKPWRNRAEPAHYPLTKRGKS